MSELPEGTRPAEPPRPRESASGIVVAHDPADGWRLLLGLRSRRSRFMPGHLACPGGALDLQDDPSSPGAYLRCVSRELREETGLEIAVEDWIKAGERITPPLFPVRFRTLFFVAGLPAGLDGDRLRPANAENEELRIVPARRVLAEWDRGKTRVPPPVLPILRALADGSSSPLEQMAREIAEVNRLEQRAPRIEFTPGVWMLPQRTPTLPPATHTNVWMPGGRRFVIVDPGSDDAGELGRLLEVVGRRRRLGHEPEAVLLTHHHRDHVGGAAEVARELELSLRADAGVLEGLGRAADDRRSAPLEEGEELDLDGMSLRVHRTPGHAPGHLAFHLPEQRLLIAGDLVSGISTILIDPVGGEMGTYLDSLARMQELDCRMLLPGHGPPLPGGELARVIGHRRGRERAILALLGDGPRALDSIAREAYRELPQMPLQLTRRQTLSHLLFLEKRGRVRREDAAGESWRLAE